MPTRREKVERLLDRREKSQAWLAKQIGKPKQSLGQWLDGSRPRDEGVWVDIAKVLDVEPEVLLDDSKDIATSVDQVVTQEPKDLDRTELMLVQGENIFLPVWRGVVAGEQDECIFQEPDTVEWGEIPKFFLAGSQAPHVICIPSGPSMAPRIRQGYRALVKFDPAPPRNTLVVAENPARQRFIKVLREKDHQELHSLNRLFPPITETRDYVFIGSVTLIIAPYEDGEPNIEWNFGRPLKA